MVDSKVLLVEDDHDLCVFVQKALKKRGVEVKFAESAKAGLLLLNDGFRPQAILMDLTLPDMSSAEFRSQSLAIEGVSEIPLVVASGRDDISAIAAELGALTTVKKPYGIEDLYETLSAVLESMDDDWIH